MSRVEQPRRSRRRPRSLRARTTLLASGLAAVLLGLAGWGLLETLDRSLTDGSDDLSRARAAELARQVHDGTLPRRIVDLGDNGVAQVVSSDGRVLASSVGLQGSGPIVSVDDVSSTPSLRVLHGVKDDNETESYRTWAVSAYGPDGAAAVLVGDSLESVDEATAAVRRGLLVGVPLLVVLMAAGTWVIVSRSLRPVERIRAEVATLSEQELERRIAVPETRDEVERLAVTMNEMLARLQESAVRQRDFVADASHELQSPLTSLRTQLEVARAHPEQDWSAAAEDLLTDTLRMERLVRDLLVLARYDEAGDPVRTELVDLDVVLDEEVRRVRAAGPVRVELGQVDAAPVRGRPDDLARLLRNVLENATTHAASGVSVVLRASDDEAVVEVTDDGPGIPPDQRERVFERFARVDGDRARSVAGGGTGLGLAIARTIAERHGGQLVVADVPTGARLVLTVPLAHVGVDPAPAVTPRGPTARRTARRSS